MQIKTHIIISLNVCKQLSEKQSDIQHGKCKKKNVIENKQYCENENRTVDTDLNTFQMCWFISGW